MQVKDPSKAAHASDEDLKDLVKFRGEELKKGPLEGAKCDKKRHEQVEHQLQQRCLAALFQHQVSGSDLKLLSTSRKETEKGGNLIQIYSKKAEYGKKLPVKYNALCNALLVSMVCISTVDMQDAYSDSVLLLPVACIVPCSSIW